MGTEKQQVQVDYVVNGSQAETQGNKLMSVFSKLNSIWLASAAALAGLIGIISKGLKDWSDQEKAVVKLNTAMKNAGTYSDKASKDLQAYATQLQKTTVYGDETILSGQALIASFGIEGQALKDLTKSTLDLASAKGMDLNSAFDLIAKTAGSSTNALSRYGIEVNGVAGSAQRTREVLAGLQKLYGGQAAAEALTFAGTMTRLKNAFGELSETIGQTFAPAIQAVAEMIMKMVNSFNDMNEGTKQAIVIIGATVVALLAFIPVAGAVVAALTAIGIAGSIALLGIPLLIAAAAAGFVYFRKNIDEARMATNTFVINFLKKFKGIIDFLSKFPGLTNIFSVDETIAKLESINQEIQKAEEKKTGIETTALVDRKQQLAEIELADQENKAEMQTIMDEAQQEKDAVEGELFRQKLMQRSADELAIAGYTADQINALKTLKDKQQKEQAKNLSKDYISFVANAAEEEKDIAKAVAKGTLEFIKEGLKKQILAKAAEISETGFALLLASLGTDPQAYAHIAAGGVLAAAGVAAVDSVQLAEGGSMVVDSPTRIGNNVIAGEAGPEQIKVTPLDQAQQTIVNNIILDGEVIAKRVLKIGQEQRLDGTLDDGL